MVIVMTMKFLELSHSSRLVKQEHNASLNTAMTMMVN